MRTNPIKPHRLTRMGCCHVQSYPTPQKWRRKTVPRPWMIPRLRLGGRGVPPWHPRPGSSRSTSSYSSRRWRSGLRNGLTREDLAPASNSATQFSRKAEVSAGFASCFFVYVRNVTEFNGMISIFWSVQSLMMFWKFMNYNCFYFCNIPMVLQINPASLYGGGKEVCLRVHCSCLQAQVGKW